MKKNIILAAVFMSFSLNLFAQNGSNVKPSVYGAFQKSFSGASNVTFTALTDQITKAQFFHDGHPWLAFFDNNGNVITSGRRIKDLQMLPLSIKSGLHNQKKRMEKKFGDLAIALVYEMVSNQGTTRYYSTLENSIVKITLSVCSNGQCIIEKKELKRDTQTIPSSPKDAIAKN
jgi:hypothetical protein